MSNYEIGVLITCVLVLLAAASAVTTRRLKELHFNIIQVYLSFVGLVISTIWLVIEMCRPDAKPMFHLAGVVPWLELFAACFFHFIAQIMTTCMNQSQNPAIVGMFLYM